MSQPCFSSALSSGRSCRPTNCISFTRLPSKSPSIHCSVAKPSTAVNSDWSSRSLGKSLFSSQQRSSLKSRSRCPALPTLALVNVDFNPSLLLGMGLVGGGLTITSLRSVKPVVSRDLDIVIACVAWMSGGILIFQHAWAAVNAVVLQGWRLDPILFFANTLIAGAAVTFSLETYQLRAKVASMEKAESGWGADKRVRTAQSKDPRSRSNASILPPPREQSWDWLNRPQEPRQADNQSSQYQYREDYADAQPSGRAGAQQSFPWNLEQADDSQRSRSQQQASFSGRDRASQQRDPIGSDGYFQPSAEATQEQPDRNASRRNFSWQARPDLPSKNSNMIARRRNDFDADGPYRTDASSPSSDSYSQQEQDGYFQPNASGGNPQNAAQASSEWRADDWDEPDGFFQPDTNGSQSSSKDSGSRKLRSSLRSPSSGWQPRTEDWD